jgi:AraC-like DNA-binding protein
MLYTILYPSPLLQGIVKRYWLADVQIPLHHTFDIQVSAAVHLGMVFLIGDSYQILYASGATRTIDESFMLGHITQSHVNRSNAGRTALFGVDFNHTVLSHLLHMPMEDFRDTYISLEAVLGPEAQLLQEKLRQAQSPAACVSIIEPFLLKLLKNTPFQKDYADYAIQLINSYEGNIGVHEIATELRISDRHLNRVFLEKVGINPKMYARLVRFSQVYKL